MSEVGFAIVTAMWNTLAESYTEAFVESDIQPTRGILQLKPP